MGNRFALGTDFYGGEHQEAWQHLRATVHYLDWLTVDVSLFCGHSAIRSNLRCTDGTPCLCTANLGPNAALTRLAFTLLFGYGVLLIPTQSRLADRDLAIESGYAMASLAAMAHDRILLGRTEELSLDHIDDGTCSGGSTLGHTPGSSVRLTPHKKRWVRVMLDFVW